MNNTHWQDFENDLVRLALTGAQEKPDVAADILATAQQRALDHPQDAGELDAYTEAWARMSDALNAMPPFHGR